MAEGGTWEQNETETDVKEMLKPAETDRGGNAQCPEETAREHEHGEKPQGSRAVESGHCTTIQIGLNGGKVRSNVSLCGRVRGEAGQEIRGTL